LFREKSRKENHSPEKSFYDLPGKRPDPALWLKIQRKSDQDSPIFSLNPGQFD